MGLEQPLPPKETYFYSPYKEYTDITIYGADPLGAAGKPLDRQQSLNREVVLRGMIPNALFVHDRKGLLWENHPFGDLNIDDEGNVSDRDANETNLYISRGEQKIIYAKSKKADDGTWKLDQESFDPESVRFVEGVYTVPVSPWGRKFALVYMDLSAQPNPALVDQNEKLMYQSLDIQSKIIEYRLARTNGKPVYWGLNNSIGLRKGRGLMSVLYPHEQIWQFRDDLSGLRPNNIKQVRKNARWDEGVSKGVAELIVMDITQDQRLNFISKYWGIANIDTDNMGFTIELPGFTPDKMSQPEFIKDFWRPLSHKIHDHLGRFHTRYYGTDFNEYCMKVTENHIENAKQNYKYTDEELDAYFRLLPEENITAPIDEKLLVLDFIKKRELNQPPGWAGAIQFTKDGAFVTITLGFLNERIGPAQGMGVDLKRRTDEKIPPDEEGQIVRKMEELKKQVSFIDA